MDIQIYAWDVEVENHLVQRLRGDNERYAMSLATLLEYIVDAIVELRQGVHDAKQRR